MDSIYESMSEENIRDLRNKHCDERIFILGNGPSLNKTPLSSLSDESTMAMNNINKIYSSTNWRPDYYYLAQSPNHPEAPSDYNSKNYLLSNIKKDITCVLSSEYQPLIGHPTNCYFFEKFDLWGKNPLNYSSINEIKSMPRDQLYSFWSDNISHHIYNYHAMYGALQVAVYMGFKEIYLLGCDLGMEYQNPHMIFSTGMDPYRFEGTKKEFLNEVWNSRRFVSSIVNTLAMMTIKYNIGEKVTNKITNIDRSDHFSTNYIDSLSISDGVKSEKQIIKSHIVANKICKDKEVNIYNATVGGELEVYERVGLSSIIN